MAGVKGRSGAAGKPVSQLVLEGTYRPDRHAHLIAPPEELVKLTPQSHISVDNVVVDREEIFEYFAENLYREGMTKDIDSVLLSQLVEAQAQYLIALSYAKSDPEAQLGNKLASQLANEFAKEVRILMTEFRLTPSSRGMKSVNSGHPSVDADPVAAFLEAKVVSDK